MFSLGTLPSHPKDRALTSSRALHTCIAVSRISLVWPYLILNGDMVVAGGWIYCDVLDDPAFEARVFDLHAKYRYKISLKLFANGRRESRL